jgi:ribosome-associated translation inhibitor RaiA
MLIQVNTDHNIQGRQELVADVESSVEDAVRHFKEQITRVEVHLNDVNSQKSGPKDKRCMMEARIEGHPPVAVTHQAESLALAMNGAADKLKASLDNTLGRLHRH